MIHWFGRRAWANLSAMTPNNSHRSRRVGAAVLVAMLVVSVSHAQETSDKAIDDNVGSAITILGPPSPSPPSVVARDDMGRVTVRATRVSTLTVDGLLDEPIYERVEPLDEWIQQEPLEGEPNTEKTHAWVFFDDQNVYIAGRFWDSHPERMVINEMRRDSFNIFQNESFTIVLDTFYDRRNGFFFQTNPLGAIRDQLVSDEGQANNNDWNTVWNAQSHIHPDGWSTEVVIPFKSLRFSKPGEQIWSINLRRVVRWKNEQHYLTRIASSFNFRGIYRFSDAATLTGVVIPGSYRNLEIKPYALGAVTTDRTADIPFENDPGGDVGFDVKYGLTKGLAADFTYNTDFAQVEEDQQQVNLTRFSLFFPEKREFFLEGQGIFAFAGVQLRGNFGNRPGRNNEELTPIVFFSRRIGLEESQVVPIDYGGRLTGRAGKFRLGLLNIQTASAEAAEIPKTNYSVLRLRRDFLRRSDVGVIVTHRNEALSDGASSNSLIGMDANLAFYQNVRFNTYYAATRTPDGLDIGSDDDSYLGRFGYDHDRYGVTAEHLKVGRDFNPELGFVRRESFRRNFVTARFSPRPTSLDWLRKVSFESQLDYITDLSGRPETRSQRAVYRMILENSDELAVEYTRQFELLNEPFEIATDVELRVGQYVFQDVRLVYQFGPQRLIPGFITYRRGSFFNGERDELNYRARIEVSRKFSLEPFIVWNWVNLDEGDFTTRLLSTRVNYTLSPRMVLSSFVQYNSASSAVSTSLRFRWEYEPGSDVFVVYSDGRDTDGDGIAELQTRSFVMKFTKLLRF